MEQKHTRHARVNYQYNGESVCMLSRIEQHVCLVINSACPGLFLHDQNKRDANTTCFVSDLLHPGRESLDLLLVSFLALVGLITQGNDPISS